MLRPQVERYLQSQDAASGSSLARSITGPWCFRPLHRLKRRGWGVRGAERAGIKKGYCEALRAENNILHGSIHCFSISHFVPRVRARARPPSPPSCLPPSPSRSFAYLTEHLALVSPRSKFMEGEPEDNGLGEVFVGGRDGCDAVPIWWDSRGLICGLGSRGRSRQREQCGERTVSASATG